MITRMYYTCPQCILQSKQLFLGARKLSSLSNEVFETDCTLGLDRISEKYEHYILLGDFNFDILDKS